MTARETVTLRAENGLAYALRILLFFQDMKLAESRAHNVGVGGVLTAVGAKVN